MAVTMASVPETRREPWNKAKLVELLPHLEAWGDDYAQTAHQLWCELHEHDLDQLEAWAFSPAYRPQAVDVRDA